MQEQESPTLMEHGFLWRNNLQRSILCVPLSIDKTLRSRFWISTGIFFFLPAGRSTRAYPRRVDLPAFFWRDIFFHY